MTRAGARILLHALAVVAVFGLAAGMPSSGAAQARPEAVPYAELGQGDRIGVIAALVDQGRLTEADLLLANSYFDEADLGYTAAYLQARVFRATDRGPEAEALLRQILNERPQFRVAQLELASLLAETGRHRAAMHHLEQLSVSAPNPAEREMLDTLTAQVRDTGRPRLSGFLEIIEDSNVNSGTDVVTYRLLGLPFVVAPAARRTPGRGLRYGATLVQTWTVSRRLAAYAAGRVTLEDFEGGRFDRQYLDLRLGLRQQLGWGHLGAEILGERAFLDRDPTDRVKGARVFGQWVASPEMQLTADLSRRERHYDAVPGAMRHETALSFRLDRRVTPHLQLWTGLRLEQETQRRVPANSFDGATVSLGAEGSLDNGMTTSLSLSRAREVYQADFIGLAEPRQDRRDELTVTVWKRDFAFQGFQPRVSVIGTRQDSTVSFYSFDRLRSSVTLTRSF